MFIQNLNVQLLLISLWMSFGISCLGLAVSCEVANELSSIVNCDDNSSRIEGHGPSSFQLVSYTSRPLEMDNTNTFPNNRIKSNTKSYVLGPHQAHRVCHRYISHKIEKGFRFYFSDT